MPEPLSEQIDAWRHVIAEGAVTAPGLAFAFARERITTPTDWGFAESHHVIVVHLAGRLRRLETVFDNGPTQTILPEAGDSWIIPAGARYAAAAVAERPGDEVRYCEIRLSPGLFGRRALTPRAGHKDGLLYHMVVRMAALARRDDDLAGLLRASLAEAIQLHIADTLGIASVSLQRPDPRRLAELLSYLGDNLDGRHTVAEMAARAGMSVDRFSRDFAAAIGTTPYRWLVGARLQRAKALLAETRCSITDVAMATGFDSPSHFASCFRRHVGLTPTAWRRSLGAGY